MNFWGRILKWTGWRVDITAPRRDKCVICVAPHTSNWDLVLGLLAYKSLGRKANFLIKKFWFFFPMNLIMKSLGGIPVSAKGSGGSLTAAIIQKFSHLDYINLAVTPEGTRSRTSKWRTGFLRIAHGAGVPIQLGVIDYKTKEVIIREEFVPTGDIDADMARVRSYYSQFADAGKYPEKFEA